MEPNEICPKCGLPLHKNHSCVWFVPFEAVTVDPQQRDPNDRTYIDAGRGLEEEADTVRVGEDYYPVEGYGYFGIDPHEANGGCQHSECYACGEEYCTWCESKCPKCGAD